MAYTGKRPIMPGQDSNDFQHPHKGEGKYSNWSVFSSTQLLEDAPLEDHEPGEGRHPGDYAASRNFKGLEDREQPLDEPGDMELIEGKAFKPYEHKGIMQALNGDYMRRYDDGWERQDAMRNLYLSVDGDQILSDPGEGETAATFGAFDPYDHEAKSASEAAMEDPGMHVPEGYDHMYGRNRVNEWRGVTKAL